MVTLIVSISVALLVSASCSIAEAVLLSLSPGQLANLVAKHQKVGKHWIEFKKDVDLPISVILVLNTTAHTIGAAVAGAAFDKLFGSTHMWLFSLVFTYVMLQFTEILPKTLGVKYNRTLAVVIARPLRIGVFVLKPFVRLLQKINRLFEPKSTANQTPKIEVDELGHLAALAQEKHLLNSKQVEIIRGTVTLSKKTANDVMISLVDVVMLSTDSTLRQVVDRLRFDAHTRIPVCRGKNRDDIAGYVNVKEILPLLSSQSEDKTLAEFPDIIHNVPFADKDATALSLLSTIIDEKCHMAVITDQIEGKEDKKDEDNKQFDKTPALRCMGIATLEDIVEELIGEISDEFDEIRLPRTLTVREDKTIIVQGGFPMHDLPRVVAQVIFSVSDDEDVDVLSVGDDFKNVAQWLRDQLGHDPVVNDVYKGEHGVDFKVTKVRHGKIYAVKISKSAEADTSETKAAGVDATNTPVSSR